MPSPLPSSRRNRCAVLLAAAALTLASMATASGADSQRLLLHVPSPDWRDQILYFVVTDRFADGNPRNNNQRAGEYDPSRANRYSGGDLAGLRQRLDYIQGLGATAVWITPPVANQWLNAQGSYSGYHGYWAEHFMKVDRHLGTLHDYRLLSDALHRRGLYLVQDIVVNHVGDFFHYRVAPPPSQPQQGWQANRGSRPVEAPSQFPFSLNNPGRSQDRRAGIYHWTPDVRDYQNREQELRFQMSGLDDLNTRNPRVREALRRSYAHWIREVGVDAFRVDTAFYVEPEFFEDFIGRPASAGGTPGMAAVARSTGRRDFLVFGEGFGIDAPGQDLHSRKIELYMHDPSSGKPRMGGMLNFPLYGALGDVLARGAATTLLAERVRRQVTLHPRLHWMPSFLDNHDVDRFLAAADERALMQGLAALFTLPGIPVVYYGTEQGFTQQRASMFAAGWGSGGRDHFNLQHPLALQLRALSELRRRHAPLRRGTPVFLAETVDDAGALVWRMSHEGEHLLVALNTSDDEVRVEELAVGVRHGAQLKPAWGLDGTPEALQADARGMVELKLPPRSAAVWQWRETNERLTADTGSRLLRRAADSVAPWVTVLEQEDPAGDDQGPEGRYRYPTEPTYERLRPADIRRVSVATRREERGTALRVTLQMNGISSVWSPRNGFDHVAFTLFLELPDQAEQGARVMPLQDGVLPADLRWHRRLRAHGWSLSLFAHQGASEQAEGTPMTSGVKVETDAASRSVTFTLSAGALGRLPSLSGARLWINTWDWDARYRSIAPQAGEFVFGGGSEGQPRVMDSSDVLVLP